MVVTYDENGGYGHPDHIQAHRVAMRGVELAADPALPRPGEPWQVAEGLLERDARVRAAGRASTRCARPATTTFFEGMDPTPTSCRASACRTSW